MPRRSGRYEGGKYLKEFTYVVEERAVPRLEPHNKDALGNPIVFDEGHAGMRLLDFLGEARRRWRAVASAGASIGPFKLTLVEVAILRLYTWSLFLPWNNALRGLNESYEPDPDALPRWATCIAVLFSAVIKLSELQPRAKDGSPISTVWRGVREDRSRLPDDFWMATDKNQGTPGGAEMAFMSTTADPTIAHTYSGGKGSGGSIMQIEYDAGSRGASLQFLSVYPREEELLLPPFTMISVKGVEVKGSKRFLRCTLTMNPSGVSMCSLTADFKELPARVVAPLASDTATTADDFRDELVAYGNTDFIDPFTCLVFEDPVLAEDGVVYERSNLENWFRQERSTHGAVRSPKTLKPMGTRMVAQPELVAAIMRARQEHAIREEQKAAAAKGGARRSGDDEKVKRIDALGEIFGQLDKLKGVLPSDYQVPMFVVLGAESSGKSSLLERIAMFTIFPRAEGTCTRIAIKVQLRRVAKNRPPQLQMCDLEGRPVGPVESFPLAGGGENFIKQKMDEVIQREHGGQTVGICLDRMIVLQVFHSKVPTIDLVDLPGIFYNADQDAGETPEHAAQTIKLASRFVELNKDAIFLTVVTAGTANSAHRLDPALKLISELKIADRSIGVHTKCDELSAAALKHLQPRLLGVTSAEKKGGLHANEQLGHGWTLSMNAPLLEDDGYTPVQKGEDGRLMFTDEEGNEVAITDEQRLERQAKAEIRWFHEAGFKDKAIFKHLGCNTLLDKMHAAFLTFVRHTWAPEVIARLDAKLQEVRDDERELGLPALAQSSPDEMTRLAKVAAQAVLRRLLETAVPKCHEDLLKPLRAHVARLETPPVSHRPSPGIGARGGRGGRGGRGAAALVHRPLPTHTCPASLEP